MVMALAGNKSDLVEARKVTAEASTFAFFFWGSLLVACMLYFGVDLGVLNIVSWITLCSLLCLEQHLLPDNHTPH